MACVSDGMVHGIEVEGQMPGIAVAEALALALGVSPCFLAFGVSTGVAAEEPQAQGVGERLRTARVERTLDKKALAQAAGMTGQAVAYIESGRRIPSVATIERLAEALGVSVCWLAFGEGPQLMPKPKRGRPPRARLAPEG